MTQMLQVNKNSNIKKKTIYKSASMISISDLATRQMQAHYVAAHYTVKTTKKKHPNYGNIYLKIM